MFNRISSLDWPWGQSVAQAGAAGLFLAAASARVAHLKYQSIKVNPSGLRRSKLFVLIIFVTLRLSVLILWTLKPSSIAAPVAGSELVASIALLVLSAFEHDRSVAPSDLIALYFAVTLPLDISQIRALLSLDKPSSTLALETTIDPIPTISIILVVVKLIALVSEALPKRHLLLASYRDLSPADTSGPYSKIFLWWINPLLWRGFFNTLTPGDLYSLDSALSSQKLEAQFRGEWKRKRNAGANRLLRVVLSTLKWQILASGLPQLLLIGVKFLQPQLIRDTTNFVNNPTGHQDGFGWRLVSTYALVYLSIAVLGAASKHQINRFIVSIRGGLISLIYQKTVNLSITELEEKAALTLISADVERITTAFGTLHETSAAFIEVVVALYLLYTQLGPGFVAPGFFFSCAVVAIAVCTRLFPKYLDIWLEAIQTRTSSTADMLGAIRNIKLLGLSSVVGGLVQRLRVQENQVARKIRWVVLVQVVFQNVTSIAAPVSTFAIYIFQERYTGQRLDIPTAFAILSILQLLEPPLMMLVRALPELVGSLGCFSRIQEFLLSPSRQERRTLQSSAPRLVDENLMGQRTDDVLVLRNSSFGWGDDSPVLHNLDLRVKRGSLVMVIGPTGCGKSTLLKGILGETPFSSGTVWLSTPSVGFADQTPWTINSTIKAGICGSSSENEPFYREVIHCCGLSADLSNLPNKDRTIVGTNGIALSGGQKLRLALARAVFARKDLLILDDIFSGLDADTEDNIVRRLFSQSGPLRSQNTSVVLVTHAVARLPHADWVVVLSKDGKIAEQGTYETLVQQTGGYVAGLAVRFKDDSGNADEAGSQSGSVETPAKHPAVDMTHEEEEDEISTKSIVSNIGDWKAITHYFAVAGRFSIGLAAFWSLIYVTAIKAPGLLLSYFASPVDHSTIVSTSWFLGSLGLAAVISLVSLTLLVLGQFFYIVPRVSNGLHQRLLHTVLLAPLSFFTSTDSGTVLNWFSNDLGVIDNELPGVLIGTMIQLAIFVIGAGLIAVSASYLLAIIPLLVLVLIAIQRFYLQTSRQLRAMRQEQQAPLYTHFQETIAGVVSIRALGWTEQFCAKNSELLDNSQRPVYLLQAIQIWLALVLNLLVAGLGTLLIATIVSLRDTVPPALVGLGLLNIMSFNESLCELVQLWSMTETSLGSLARVRGFIDNIEPEVKLLETVSPAPTWPPHGAVDINNFAASYSESSSLVLQDVSLQIQPGEKIGICGRTGSGKSSLLASLFHLLEFRQGSITIDGLDLTLLSRETLRQRLNIITQEPYWVTSETVRFNLDPWGATTQDDEILIRVLEKCQVWSVVESKGGLSAIMAGDFLSHGQRQLFCLARSLLRKSKVVVLDEVSSSVDIQTDRIMQAIIRDEFQGCTIISVAHRLNTIVDFGRVVVLHEGRVVESGKPQELLAQSESRFKKLYEL
ncbi:ABC transporter, integral membrane type 1 [Penicillium expansum]|nr:ABC transporter, integral membrane type 1 [Penicillium expansum]